MVFLHGILGSGSNFRTLARRFVEACPGWGAVLVDLRMHGASVGFSPPHTVAAAAEDVVAAVAGMGSSPSASPSATTVGGAVAGVLGHSFGGKVALLFAERMETAQVVWVLDSNPGARPDGAGSDEVLRVLAVLRGLPPTFATREAFVEAVMAEGISAPTTQWLAMNVRPSGDAFRFRIDLDAIDELLRDYWHLDLWPIAEAPPARLRVHHVLGARSTVYGAAARERAERAADARPDRVFVHVVEEAGHWVHSDRPDAVLSLLTAHDGR
jgi:pimeloyl-ACP methyl ester carboxylesterase